MKFMARIRTIKPSFWTDEKIGKLSFGARLLFIASWNLADDEGIIIWNESYLRGQVFPYEKKLPLSQVKRMMDELIQQKLCVFYRCGCDSYAFIPGFHKHQVISKGQPSTKPLPTSPDFKAKFTDNSSNVPVSFPDHSEWEGKGIRKGREGNKEVEGKGNGKGLEKSTTTTSEVNGNIFKSYESNIGQLTPAISDRMKILIKEHPPDWIIEAIEKATRMEKRNLGYVEGILKGWKAEGKGNEHFTGKSRGNQGGGGAKANQSGPITARTQEYSAEELRASYE
jgi:DnaD/phage-associated family protein